MFIRLELGFETNDKIEHYVNIPHFHEYTHHMRTKSTQQAPTFL